jgi:hypothetical protein
MKKIILTILLVVGFAYAGEVENKENGKELRFIDMVLDLPSLEVVNNNLVNKENVVVYKKEVVYIREKINKASNFVIAYYNRVKGV